MVNVAVDAMGGDNAPMETVKGAVEALNGDKRVKDATTDPAQIAAWWDGTYLYNVGLATGGGVVVLDVDINHSAGKYGDETLAELEVQHGPLPETWMCLTGGGGVHYYFACDDPALTVGTGFAPGLDYRGAGGYVVAPPSLHDSGREYEWEAAHTPANTALAPLPDWLHSLMLEGRKQAPRTRTEAAPERSEERRVGKEWAGMCRSRWARYH